MNYEQISSNNSKFDALTLFKLSYSGFIIGAAAISIKFWADKYCLLRVYSPSAAIGPQVGNFGKTYFFRLAVLVG